MRHQCPFCQCDADLPDAEETIICHACGGEYRLRLVIEPVQAGPEPRSEETNEQVAHEQNTNDPEPAALQPPIPASPQIWPWLSAILALLCIVGFAVQKDAWLDHRGLRSTLLDLGIDMQQRAKDWRIAPASIRARWVEDADGNPLMQIDGRIENLLASAVAAPDISITFYAADNGRKELTRRIVKLTSVPPRLPILSFRGSKTRDFSLLIDQVPEGSGDFALTPVIK